MQNIDAIDLSLDKKLKEYRDILELFSEQKESLTKNYISAFEEILTAFKPIKEEAIENNRKTSCNFNPLKQFVKLNETMHSKMLAFLLNPKGKHGQGNLFLFDFLNRIGIAEPDKGEWIITAEKERVDILLKRKEPSSVVVIENKSNGAADQPNQIYRYWHKEMYRNPEYQKIKDKDLLSKYYKIIYLPADNLKTPDPFSFKKPADIFGYDLSVSNEEHEELPQNVPLVCQHITFKKDIVKLLKEVKSKLSKENHKLREFVEQYLEIWN